jgi:hypothetical protein
MNVGLKKFSPLLVALTLAACVTAPTGPRVAALPGSHKSPDQFQYDRSECQQFAQQSIGGNQAGQVASDQAASNAVAGTLFGAASGAIIGAVTGNAGPGAAIGAATGLLFGSAAGSNAAAYTYEQAQQHYDGAYLQCMYAKGNQVPAPPRYRAPQPYYYGPPPQPYYNAPPPGPNYYGPPAG